MTGRSTYKSKVQGLENDPFNVGASSDPTKFSKSLKNIENYIQKTYKNPDDMVKTIQKIKGVVHAWVGQKHLNCFIFKWFFLSVIVS